MPVQWLWLEEHFEERIKGQVAAIEAKVKVIKAGKAGLPRRVC
jgi:ATP-dependent Clp protease ATP-binding subunit ClpA